MERIEWKLGKMACCCDLRQIQGCVWQNWQLGQLWQPSRRRLIRKLVDKEGLGQKTAFWRQGSKHKKGQVIYRATQCSWLKRIPLKSSILNYLVHIGSINLMVNRWRPICAGGVNSTHGEFLVFCLFFSQLLYSKKWTRNRRGVLVKCHGMEVKGQVHLFQVSTSDFVSSSILNCSLNLRLSCISVHQQIWIFGPKACPGICCWRLARPLCWFTVGYTRL